MSDQARGLSCRVREDRRIRGSTTTLPNARRWGNPNQGRISSAAKAESAEGSSGPDRVTLAAFGLFVTLAGGNVIAVRGVYVGALRRPSEEQVPEAVGVPSER